ncbi:MAG: hypothetical protein WA705_24675 [Candidatus Ozemobacteraceae bacterium]
MELENGFISFLKEADHAWIGKTISLVDLDLPGTLRKEIPEFFPSGTALTFIISSRGELRHLVFPAHLSEKEILGNIQLKREEVFGSREELEIRIRLGPINDEKKRDVFVSFIPKSLMEQLISLCESLGYPLKRVVSACEAFLGAFQRHVQKPLEDPFVLVQVGFSYVHLAIWKNRELLMARSLLTGSYRELESQILDIFLISRKNLREMLDGTIPIDDPSLRETIMNNRQELMTQVASLISFLRGKKLLTPKSAIFLSQPYMEDRSFPEMVSERFSIPITNLTGLMDSEKIHSPESVRLVWLSGAGVSGVLNLLPPKSSIKIQMSISPRHAAVAAFILAISPLPILRLVEKQVQTEISQLIARYEPCREILAGFAANAALKNHIEKITKDVAVDLQNRGQITRLTRYITESLPAFTRLERLEINAREKVFFVSGFTVDTETALRYFDSIQSFKGISKCEFGISDLSSYRVKFEIHGSLGKKSS